MVNIPYHAGRLRARVNRALFLKMLPRLAGRAVPQTHRLPVSVYAFSCERDLPEQAASIYSFLRHVGIPARFVVVSDGTYTPQSIALLRRVHSSVEVVEWTQIAVPPLPNGLAEYSARAPLGKKLASLTCLPTDMPVLYVDADVLFFRGGEYLRDCLLETETTARYLPDCALALDERMLTCEQERRDPINSGVFLLRQPLDWQSALARLAQVSSAPHYFTEQTTVHLALHGNGAKPLDAATYVVGRDDQFLYTEDYINSKTVLRHYVGPVRHKFWFHLRRAWGAG